MNDRVPMTEETRAEFEKPNVRVWVERMRKERPGVIFYMDYVGACALSGEEWARPRSTWSKLMVPEATALYAVALREGRALLEDPPQAELAPADPPATVRPVCAHCGQTCWREERDYEGKPICSDCSGDIANDACGFPRQSLDPRIAAAQSAQRDAGPWDAGATPAFEWEEWR